MYLVYYMALFVEYPCDMSNSIVFVLHFKT